MDFAKNKKTSLQEFVKRCNKAHQRTTHPLRAVSLIGLSQKTIRNNSLPFAIPRHSREEQMKKHYNKQFQKVRPLYAVIVTHFFGFVNSKKRFFAISYLRRILCVAKKFFTLQGGMFLSVIKHGKSRFAVYQSLPSFLI